MHEAVETALQALTHWQGHDAETSPDLELIDSMLVQPNLLPNETLSLIPLLRDKQSELDEARADKLLTQSDSLLSQATSLLAQAG
ncbi:MAG: hypothetical protein IME93_02400 [Proteobacteria bacterium]|nr:hypothetical protein [Pseudomonadota bacterium]